jgi:hypothetical protein
MKQYNDCFLSRINKMGSYCEKLNSRCWEFNGSDNGEGYKRVYVSGKSEYAHRYAYREFVGEIPENMTIDHLCRNRGCVNPGHLEVVTRAENVSRRVSIPPRGGGRCKNGHALTEDNIRMSRNSVICKTCQRISQAIRDKNRVGAHQKRAIT